MKLDKNYKVRVTPEQSRQIQELVFKLGGNLQSGDTSVKETHLERLYVSKCLKMSFGLTEHGWSYQEGATIQADDLIALLTDLSKSAENPLQNIELTPEFETEASEPKFKVGDKVYYRAYADICVVSDVSDLGEVQIKGWREDYYNSKYFCHATQENYEMLCNLYPHIEFEQPPKELKGSDLCRAMLEKGWKYVPCYVHDGSDDEAINRKHYVSVKNETPRSGYNFSGTGANDWKYAVPIDPRTGEPLTEAVLDE